MKQKFYVRLFITLILLTIIPIFLLSYFSSYSSSGLLEDEVNKVNELLLSNIKNNIDFNLSPIKTDFFNFIYSNGYLDFYTGKSSPDRFYMSAYLQRDLSGFKNKHPLVDDFVFFNKSLDLLLTSAGSYKSGYYFEEFQCKEYVQPFAQPQFFQPNKISSYRASSGQVFSALVYYHTYLADTPDHS